ncbi:MAG TPA: hypothetical protein VFL13_15035 [Candidatus Baltobacteraceae bacterium]|nr:hypothetical protein [Candidatus Baltobacteraceae bacterium]
MQERFWRSAPLLLTISFAVTFVLYAAHPGEPQASTVSKYLAISAPWHIVLFAATFVQLVTAALIAGASLQRPGAAIGLLLAAIGLNVDFVHASAEGFIFPPLARSMPASQFVEVVRSIYAAPSELVLTLVGLVATTAGLAVLALSKSTGTAVRAFAGAAALLVPVSLAVPGAFDACILCTYVALALTARSLTPRTADLPYNPAILEANA